MEENHIGRLPVMDEDGKLLGIISDRDLKKALGPANASGSCAVDAQKRLVSEIMNTNPVKVHIYDTIEEAAQLMLEHGISGLPVVDDAEAVVAVITQNDIFRALVALSGITHGGVQFGLDLPDQAGSIRSATDIIRKYGGRLVSIFTSYDRVAPGRRKVFIRAKSVDRSQLMRIKDELTQVGVLLYILDSREKKKELVALGRMTAQQS
jgi:acetoin utilization protein AcuB